MSDALHGSTTNIEALVDEIVARRPARIRWRPSNYAGLKASYRRQKYSRCETVNVQGQNIRLLTPREIAEFRTGVQRVIDSATDGARMLRVSQPGNSARGRARGHGEQVMRGNDRVRVRMPTPRAAGSRCKPRTPCWQPACERCRPA